MLWNPTLGRRALTRRPGVHVVKPQIRVAEAWLTLQDTADAGGLTGGKADG